MYISLKQDSIINVFGKSFLIVSIKVTIVFLINIFPLLISPLVRFVVTIFFIYYKSQILNTKSNYAHKRHMCSPRPFSSYFISVLRKKNKKTDIWSLLNQNGAWNAWWSGHKKTPALFVCFDYCNPSQRCAGISTLT